MTEFIAGSLSGLSQNIIGHPFDTIKVLIQNNKWNKNRIPYLYKGFFYPTALSIIINGITFQTNSYLADTNTGESQHSEELNVSNDDMDKIYSKSKYKVDSNHFKSGFYTGLATSPIVYIFEVGKVKKQIGEKIKLKSFYKTPGFYMTVLRESTALSLYLGSYFTLTENNYSPLFSGGMAGLINWTLTYPIDVIKNRQMSDNISIKQAIKRGNFLKGYGTCAFRGVLVNSISFYVYDYTKNHISTYKTPSK